jgi:ATP-dependent RNA helicase RhlE
MKAELLNELISRQELRNTIVFTRTKEGAERLAKALHRNGHTVSMLHAKLSHTDRERSLDDLRRGRIQVLVATDLASRGVDVDGISHVVNFDVPSVPEDYVHRIRRSGPGGGAGDAFTLMSPEEQKEVAEIERFLGRAVARVMLPDFDYRMRPAEIKQVVSYDENHRKERPAVPVKPAVAAARPRPSATKPKGDKSPKAPKAAAAAAPRPAAKGAGRGHSETSRSRH